MAVPPLGLVWALQANLIISDLLGTAVEAEFSLHFSFPKVVWDRSIKLKPLGVTAGSAKNSPQNFILHPGLGNINILFSREGKHVKI